MAVVTDGKQKQQEKSLLMMEVKVLSARCLKGPSSLFSGRLRPYVALSSTATSDVVSDPDDLPAPFPSTSDYDKGSGVLYRTRVDEHGAENPTWGDTVRLPLHPSFLRPAPGGAAAPAVYLLVLSKRRLAGPARVGWCRIPACDVVDGLRPPCSVRRLSYALRNCRHGGRGHGVVDVAVRLVGPALSSVPSPANAPAAVLGSVQVLGVPPGWAGEVAIGMPVWGFGGVPAAAAVRKQRGGVGGNPWG